MLSSDCNYHQNLILIGCSQLLYRSVYMLINCHTPVIDAVTNRLPDHKVIPKAAASVTH